MSYAAPPRRARSLTLALTAILFLALVVSRTAGAAVTPQEVNFETSGLQQFDQLNASVGSLNAVAGGYGDAHAAEAKYAGGGENGYSRGIFNVDWHAGDDVWYSAAYYLPTGFKAAMQGQVALMRWDDYGAHPEGADYSGVVIYGGDKRARLIIDHIADHSQIELGPAFDLPEGRWFHIEVHQRLGATSGLNEVYLDGTKISSSTKPNLEPGRGVDRIRYGIVAIASGSQTNPLNLRFDRATVSTSQVGPNAALAQPVTPPPPPPVTTTTTPPPATTPVVSTTPPPVTSSPTPISTTTTKKKPHRRARYTPQVRKCVKAALKRAQRRGFVTSLERSVTRCVAKHG
jgi:hypothetical protein